MAKDMNSEKIGELEFELICQFDRDTKKNGTSKNSKEDIVPKISKGYIFLGIFIEKIKV